MRQEPVLVPCRPPAPETLGVAGPALRAPPYRQGTGDCEKSSLLGHAVSGRLGWQLTLWSGGPYRVWSSSLESVEPLSHPWDSSKVSPWQVAAVGPAPFPLGPQVPGAVLQLQGQGLLWGGAPRQVFAGWEQWSDIGWCFLKVLLEAWPPGQQHGVSALGTSSREPPTQIPALLPEHWLQKWVPATK